MLIFDLDHLEVATEEINEVLGGACTTRRLNNFLIRACVPGPRKPNIAITPVGGRRRFGDDDDDDNGDDN